MKAYLDTNFITRLYLEGPESEQAEELVTEMANGTFPMTWLLRMETVNAFQQYVYLGKTGQARGVTGENGLAAYSGFLEDVERGFYVHVEAHAAELMECFEDMALRHTANHGFRTYDLLHVAFAIVLKCEAFYSFDSRARKLARLEGVRTNG